MTDPMPTIMETLVGALYLTQSPTGGFGNRLHLPDGWVNITRFTRPYRDETVEYHGPVISRTDTVIVIEVHGQPMGFAVDKDLLVTS